MNLVYEIPVDSEEDLQARVIVEVDVGLQGIVNRVYSLRNGWLEIVNKTRPVIRLNFFHKYMIGYPTHLFKPAE